MPERRIRRVGIVFALVVAMAATIMWLLWLRPAPNTHHPVAPPTLGFPAMPGTVTPLPPTAPSPSAASAPTALLQSPMASGRAVFYNLSGDVACSFPALPGDGLYASVPTPDYGTADLCGSFLDIAGPRGTVRVEVVDRCPGCGPGQLDLTPAAFAQLADPAAGIAPIRYTPVRDPEPVGPLAFEVKPGSSIDWLGLLVAETGNPVRQVAIATTDGIWRPLKRGMDNYWTMSLAGPGPFAVQVTDIYGHQAQASGITLTPGVVQQSSMPLYRP